MPVVSGLQSGSNFIAPCGISLGNVVHLMSFQLFYCMRILTGPVGAGIATSSDLAGPSSIVHTVPRTRGAVGTEGVNSWCLGCCSMDEKQRRQIAAEGSSEVWSINNLSIPDIKSLGFDQPN